MVRALGLLERAGAELCLLLGGAAGFAYGQVILMKAVGVVIVSRVNPPGGINGYLSSSHWVHVGRAKYKTTVLPIRQSIFVKACIASVAKRAPIHIYINGFLGQ